MTQRQTIALWEKLSKCIADEIAINRDFASKIGELFSLTSGDGPAKKRSNRSVKGKIDPFAEFEKGEQVLQMALDSLTIEELKDVIAENGMDSAKLAMKWKDRVKLTDLIIDKTQRRAAKGDAFWNATSDEDKI